MIDIKPSIRFEKSSDPNSITVIAEPLQKGFGMTVGNSLRRVLLSSISGSAVVGIKFSCAKYEFCTIPHIYEDVQVIVANLAGLPISLEGSPHSTHLMKLVVNGKKDYTSDDIETNGGTICASGVHILSATSDDVDPFEIEIFTSQGMGYTTAEMHPKGAINADIFVDALFSPVLNVKYSVDNARIGHITDFDKLILDVQTNGAKDPKTAIIEASTILTEQFSIFAMGFGETDYTPVAEATTDTSDSLLSISHDEVRVDTVPAASNTDPKFHMLIEDMELSIRSENCIKSEGIKYIGDLVQKSESDMLGISNFGKKSLVEIKEALSKLDLSFGMYIDNWHPTR